MRSLLLNIALEAGALTPCRCGRHHRPGDDGAEQDAFAAVAVAFEGKQLMAVTALSTLLDEASGECAGGQPSKRSRCGPLGGG